MKENLRLARLFFVALAIVAGGRWAQSLRGIPYSLGNPVFSIVTLTVLAAVFISLAYNVVGISFALRGLLTPLASAVLMPISSLTVIAVSIGTMRWRPPRVDVR